MTTIRRMDHPLNTHLHCQTHHLVIQPTTEQVGHLERFWTVI